MSRPAEAAPALLYKEGDEIILDGEEFDPHLEDAGIWADTINALPVASSLNPGDKLLVLKGVESRIVRGTCTGASSDPNTTNIGDVSISVEEGLDAVAFATAIVAAADTPTNLALMKALSITDNGDGTFDVEFLPGIQANSFVCNGTDDNPTFADLSTGDAVLEQIDQFGILAGVGGKIPVVADEAQRRSLTDIDIGYVVYQVDQHSYFGLINTAISSDSQDWEWIRFATLADIEGAYAPLDGPTFTGQVTMGQLFLDAISLNNENVSLGDNDSGGSGFRALVVPNT